MIVPVVMENLGDCLQIGGFCLVVGRLAQGPNITNGATPPSLEKFFFVFVFLFNNLSIYHLVLLIILT